MTWNSGVNRKNHLPVVGQTTNKNQTTGGVSFRSGVMALMEGTGNGGISTLEGARQEQLRWGGALRSDG